MSAMYNMENDIYTTKYGRPGNMKDSHVWIHKNLEIRYSEMID